MSVTDLGAGDSPMRKKKKKALGDMGSSWKAEDKSVWIKCSKSDSLECYEKHKAGKEWGGEKDFNCK